MDGRGLDIPEELGQEVDGIHGVLVLLIEHKMTETPAVLWPRMLSRGFSGTHEWRDERLNVKMDKEMYQTQSAFKIVLFTCFHF